MNEQSEQINELAMALSKAQREIEGAIKDSNNPFFKSTYANLESVWAACQAPLTKNGLSVSQFFGYIPDVGPTLITKLLHSSGQWLRGEQGLYAKNASPQDIASATTYARRIALAAMVGVVQVDDDGEAAQASHRHQNTDPKDFQNSKPQFPPAGASSSVPFNQNSSSAGGSPLHCGQPMIVSKYPNKDGPRKGKQDWYCLKCHAKEPRDEVGE